MHQHKRTRMCEREDLLMEGVTREILDKTTREMPVLAATYTDKTGLHISGGHLRRAL